MARRRETAAPGDGADGTKRRAGTAGAEPAPPAVPDPKALRALAHPLRWKLIDLLDSETEATATRCAEVLGESVASCSYHLGILAKYGYTEPAPERPGREKPWRLTSREQNLSPGGLDVEGKLAAEAATEVFLDHEVARLKGHLRGRSLEREPWHDGPGVVGETTWLTASELKQVSEELKATVLRYSDRSADPASRPAGSREVRLFVAVTVAPPLPAKREG